jgi:hypothetical protein
MKLSLPIQACNKLNANTIDLFALVMYLHQLWTLWIGASLCLNEMWHKLKTQMFVKRLTWSFGQNIHFLWKLMNFTLYVHVEGDGLTVCKARVGVIF